MFCVPVYIGSAKSCVKIFIVLSCSSGGELAELELELDREVVEYRAQALVVNTKASYRAYLAAYLRFCQQFNYLPVPVTTIIILRYAAYLARRLKPASIAKYLTVIRLLHIEAGLPNPLENLWALQSLLKGIKRVKGSAVSRKFPITPAILLQMRSRLDLRAPRDAVFWAACLIAFFGLLCKSNILAPDNQPFDCQKHLARCHFFTHAWGLEVQFGWSKTIQFSERRLSVVLPALPSHPLCPVTAVANCFAKTFGASPLGPAFVVPTPLGFKPLTYKAFLAQLRSLLTALSLPGASYGSHSFRRGGASFSLQAGLPGDVIQVLGDWRSQAFREYLEIPLDNKVAYAVHLAQSLPTTI